MVGFVVVLILSYLIGTISTGLLLTRLAGMEDIRKSGSGNIGATNVYRVAGRRLGVLTLIGDTLKGVVPVLYIQSAGAYSPTQVALVAVAVFLGHCYPFYLGFKGGKGVATALGIFLVLSPLAVLGALGVFAAILWKWRFISLASISAAVVIPFLLLLVEKDLPLFAATLFVSAMVVLRHRTNIERLLAGTENRFKA